MAVAIRLHGRAAKRGLIPRVPDAERMTGDIEAWLRISYPDEVRSVRRTPSVAGFGEVRAHLHPSAPPVVLTVDDTGTVTASAHTEAPGPGYHTFVWRLLARLGAELEIAWADPDAPVRQLWDGSSLPAVDRAAVERAHLIALRAALLDAPTRARGAAGEHRLNLPAGTRYAPASAADAILTPLGPRDVAWLVRAIDDPAVAIDVLPWWADATDGRCLLNRALCLMWTEVRWRPPRTEDERAVIDEVLRLLKRAYPLDPSLPFPWREWTELLEVRAADDPLRRMVNDRATAADDATPLVGYRRRPVVVEHEGWELEVPGSFAERRTDGEWWGGEAGRRITLAAVSTGSGAAALRPEAFLDQVTGDFGPSILRHADGSLVGRARVDTDTASGLSHHVLEGFSAVTGSGAAIRVEFDDPDDWQWAIARWHALRPVAMSAEAPSSEVLTATTSS